MGFLDRVAAGLEQRAVNANVFFDAIQARKTPAGKAVTPSSAIQGTVAVYAAVSLLAETVGSLPLHTYRRIDDRRRERVSPTLDRWPGRLARMLHDGPNPEMTGQEFWETVEGHKNLWGNHYSYIVRSGDGRPREMWPLRPDQMEVFRDLDSRGLPVGPRRYVYVLPNGEKVGLTRDQVFHVPDLTTDGTVGLSRIEVARNAIGIEQAAADYAGRFFSNSAVPGGVLIDPNPRKPEKVKELRRMWESVVGGLDNAQRIAVLHGGVDYKAVGIPPKDAQFIELRRFQIEEIARLYRIPLHLLGDTTKESSWGTGIEQMTIGFVVYTLRAHLKRIEGAVNRDLRDPVSGVALSDEGVYAEFKVDGLLRGDMAARSAFYASGILNGYLTREDVRAYENLDPISGLDVPLMPSTHVPVGSDGMPIHPEPPPPPAPVVTDEPDGESEEHEPPRSRREALDIAYREHLEKFVPPSLPEEG